MTLTEMIVELRRELAGELPLKLHASAPAAGRHTKGGPAEPSSDDVPEDRPKGHYYQPGMTGLPFSRQFDRFLSGNHGGDYLATDSFTEIRDWCRKEHWRERHTGDNPFAWNLCARLAIAAVELSQPLAFIAEREDIDVWLARNLLTAALEHAREWRVDRRKGIIIGDESRKQLDTADSLPIVLAREHLTAHERELWEIIRAMHPCDCGGALKRPGHGIGSHFYLPKWDAELNRRRAYHALHCSPSCRLLMDDAA